MKHTLIYLLLILTLFSCIKLEENDKKYSARKLQRMLEGTWEVTGYEVDGISYLDTLFKVNPKRNCHTYTFVQWKNAKENKESGDFDTGVFRGDCFTTPNKGYEFDPKNKALLIGLSGCFVDSVFFFDGIYGVDVIKLENNELILKDYENAKTRRISFKKL